MRNLSSKLITGPIEEPVTLVEMKTHLKVPSVLTDDDSYISGLISAARGEAEKFTRRAFLNQTWEQYFDHFPASGILPDRDQVAYSHDIDRWFLRLLRPPLQSVTSITYIDMNGATQTLDQANYVVDAATEPARISPAFGKFWPPARLIPNAVTVRFLAGYADTTADALLVDPTFQSIKLAIMHLVGHWYFNREPVVAGAVVILPMHVQALLWSHRVMSF